MDGELVANAKVSWMNGAGNKRGHDPQRAGEEYRFVRLLRKAYHHHDSK